MRGIAMPDDIPNPTVMPVDRDRWKVELNLSNFVNTFYQYRDLKTFSDVRRILIVGPGQGLDRDVFKARGLEVVTLDIDLTFNPDHQGSVHDMRMFRPGEFDVVIASHVLEHFSAAYLDQSLKEIARVGRHALIYLPVHGRHIQFRLKPGLLGLDLSLGFDLFNYFERPDGNVPQYMAGQHFWEVGMRGFRVRDILRRMESHFSVLSHYRNRDWLPSYNFVLKSKASQAV